MTPLLFKYLTQYMAWVDDGADPDVFNPAHGLCDNLRYRLHALAEMRMCTIEEADMAETELSELLSMLVDADSPDEEFPFGGYDVYMRDAKARTHHLNPQRIEWVRRMLDTTPMEVE